MIIEELHPSHCCCNKTITDLDHYEICPICGWEDDPIQSEDPEFSGGTNVSHLNDARKKYLKENS